MAVDLAASVVVDLGLVEMAVVDLGLVALVVVDLGLAALAAVDLGLAASVAVDLGLAALVAVDLGLAALVAGAPAFLMSYPPILTEPPMCHLLPFDRSDHKSAAASGDLDTHQTSDFRHILIYHIPLQLFSVFFLHQRDTNLSSVPFPFHIPILSYTYSERDMSYKKVSSVRSRKLHMANSPASAVAYSMHRCYRPLICSIF